MSDGSNSIRHAGDSAAQPARDNGPHPQEKATPARPNGVNEKPEGKTEESKTKPPTKAEQILNNVLKNPHIAWIKPRLNFKSLKPVIRMALSVRNTESSELITDVDWIPVHAYYSSGIGNGSSCMYAVS